MSRVLLKKCKRENNRETVKWCSETSFSVKRRAITKAQEKKFDDAEVKMLRWVCDIRRKDRTRNETIRGIVKVGLSGKKFRNVFWSGSGMKIGMKTV